ncbi:MAG: methyltransferase domain-containing protein [Fibrobacterota bacterium]
MNRRALIRKIITGEVLDVGCAYGQLHAYIRSMHKAGRVHGLDIAPSPWPDTVIGDACALDTRFAAGTFDTVIAGEIIEHLPDPPRFLRACWAVLKPGGRLLVTTPNLDSWGLAVCSHGRHSEHISLMTTQTLRERVEQAGFKILELYVTWYRPESTPGTKWYLKPLFPVRALLNALLPKRWHEQTVLLAEKT